MAKTLREKYLEQFTENCLDIIELTKRKNQDYSAGDDAFGNFRQSEVIAGVDVPHGILVRIGDKLSRIRNLLNRPGYGGAVSDEKLTDTIKDLVTYSNILLTWFQLGEPVEGTTYEELEGGGQLEPPPEEKPKKTLDKVFKWGKNIIK